MDKSETLPYRPSDNVSGGQESMNRSFINGIQQTVRRTVS